MAHPSTSSGRGGAGQGGELTVIDHTLVAMPGRVR